MEGTVQRSDYDPGPAEVFERARERAGPDPEAFFGQIIRRSVDEVLDGPRTGRWWPDPNPRSTPDESVGLFSVVSVAPAGGGSP